MYRMALAILEIYQSYLLEIEDKQDFINYLQKENISNTDINILLKTGYSFSFTRKTVKKYRSRMENKILHIEEPNSHVYYRPKITHPSSLFPDEMFEIIYEWIPMKHRIKAPEMIYNSDEDGTSFITFYSKVSEYTPTLLVLKSQEQHVFGAFIPIHWDTKLRQLTGCSDIFLFRITPDPQKYGWNPDSTENFVSINSDRFTIGLQQGVGLDVGEEWIATSSECENFNNPPLNGENSSGFQIVKIEVFSFV